MSSTINNAGTSPGENCTNIRTLLARVKSVSSVVLSCMRRNIYTNPDLAARVVSKLDLAKADSIADLGCGDGVFLEAIADRLLQTRTGILLDTLASHIYGVDIDPNRSTRTEMALNEKYGNPCYGWNVICGDVLSLDESVKFDAIVGNPPWVRIHHMDERTKELARNKFLLGKGIFDLYHLFIEKSVRLLKSGGQILIIIPEAFNYGPASQAAREYLSSQGDWSLTRISSDNFNPRAVIKPALLTFRKADVPHVAECSKGELKENIDSIATVTSGVPTGSDSVFIVKESVIQDWELEEHRLKPVIRGRDIRKGKKIGYNGRKVVWPYYKDSYGKWSIDDLKDSPNTLKYLRVYKSHLTTRPKLQNFVKRNPLHWYRFIDPNRHKSTATLKVILPDVFKSREYSRLENPDVIVHNTCFQIIPKVGFEQTLLNTMKSNVFWDFLKKRSRPIQNDYHRTSVSELKTLPLY